MSILRALDTAFPPYVLSQATAAEELKRRMGESGVVGRMIDAAAARSGIATRRIVIPDAEPDVKERFYSIAPGGPHPDTARRMALYREWSSRLAVEAASSVLRRGGVSESTVTRLITVSCTGFSAPNFDHEIVARLGISPNVKRTHIGFMGCAAGLVGLSSVLEASCDPSNGSILLVAVELCSLHFQPEPTRDNILASTIFADGCAAALFARSSEERGSLRLRCTRSFSFENSREVMGWQIGNHGFQMSLSASLPEIISEKAIPTAKAILLEMQLSPDRIPHWALHPGGRAILDALQSGLGLSDDQVAPSRAILAEYGNTSSVSILAVLKELIERRRIEQGERVCAIAFGPGLTMEMALFEGV